MHLAIVERIVEPTDQHAIRLEVSTLRFTQSVEPTEWQIWKPATGLIAEVGNQIRGDDLIAGEVEQYVVLAKSGPDREDSSGPLQDPPIARVQLMHPWSK